MDTLLITVDDVYDLTQKRLIAECGEVIRDGGLVAFPTETVYGLGADALNEDAAAKIYEAKGRPSDNPLIVHICDIAQVDEIASGVTDQARAMMERFWPGPLTIIFPKKPIVPDGTTGGLDTVAIRMPEHPIALELIRSSGRMIAAPSANRSGRPSPTLAEHVYEDMKGRIPRIIDGGPVSIGIESTIVDMSEGIPMILRPGFITKEMLEDVVGPVEMDPFLIAMEEGEDIRPKAPGMKYRHYAPKGQLTIVDGDLELVADKINELVAEKKRAGYKVGVICTNESRYHYEEGVAFRIVGSRNNPQTVAKNLFRILREFDEIGTEVIYSESFFDEGLGVAIMNRLLKAAGHQVLEV